MSARLFLAHNLTAIWRVGRAATLAYLILVLGGPEPAPAAAVYLESVYLTEESALQLEVVDEGVGAAGYALESTPALYLGANEWVSVVDHSVSPAGAGRFVILVPIEEDTQCFYRVRTLGDDAPDTDWDGLSDALEAWLGTAPANPDSDGDLFSDGLEVDANTDPLIPIDFPALTLQPSVRFAANTTKAGEVDGLITVSLEIDPPFAGLVHYEIGVLSNVALEGDTSDFAPFTGQVQVDGAVAILELSCVDDPWIEDVEILVIDLLDDPGGRYHVGSIPRHTVMLYDNDAYWNGVLARDDTELPFRLRLIQSGGAFTATLVSSLDPALTGGAPGIGTIPPGDWPVTITRGADTFVAVSDPIPFSTSLMFQAEMTRQLTLSAIPPEDPDNPEAPYWLTEKAVVGTYTDMLQPVDPALGYLARETEGSFILLKDFPAMEEVTVPTRTAATTSAAGAPLTSRPEVLR